MRAHLALEKISCYFPYFTHVLSTPTTVAGAAACNGRTPLSPASNGQ